MVTQSVIDELQNRGFKVRSYSGRAMYGAQCVGVDVNHMGEVLKIGAVLIGAGFPFTEVDRLGDTMRTDNMGKGYILYWPSLGVTPGTRIARDEDDDEEDD